MAERAVAGILAAARANPCCPALDVAGEVWSYHDLLTAAATLAARLPPRGQGTQPRVAVMANRQASAYLGILAAQLAGAAYVPINVNHPAARSAQILASAGVTHVICGDLASDRLRSILVAEGAPHNLEVIVAGDRKSDYVPSENLPVPTGETCDGDLAYILFTSGSTGLPKGVPIGHTQLAAYLSAAQLLLPDLGTKDRFSQCFDLTFDLSVHDVFLSLQLGGTLVVPSRSELEDPARYIRERGITAWFSVPSLAFQIQLQGGLDPSAFSELRSSLFCGEELPLALAETWRLATPNGVVENWYGPTEATIACMYHPVTCSETPPGIPIGRPFPGMTCHVLDENMTPVEQGELFLSGPQLAEGYLNDPETTARAFITLPDGKRAYRTGDLARRDKSGEIHFMGRIDNQIKLRGHRVELGEVEAVLRDSAGGANAVALPWPWGDHTPRRLVAAVEGPIDVAAMRAMLTDRLPEYMVPSEIVAVERFPRNASGKANRAGIAALVAEQLSDVEFPEGLSEAATRLLNALRTAAPGVSAKSLLSAQNLLDAGVDSLAFVEFTMLLQRDFDLSMDQDGVERMAEMSFSQIVDLVSPQRRKPLIWLKTLTGRLSRHLKRNRKSARTRTNRAIQFIERFPKVISSGGPPIVLAVGSSGTLRAIDPKIIEDDAALQGVTVRALNVGLPAITPGGLMLVCRFIREQCQAADVRLPLVLYEFDPMHVSTTPPSGDISLGPEFFEGKVAPRTSTSLAREFEWAPDQGGAWIPGENSAAQERRPDWAKKREELIAHAYQGAFEIDPIRLNDWYKGAQELARIADQIVCFVHPADPKMLAEKPASPQVDLLEKTLAEIRDTLGINVVPWRDFQLQRLEYMNINHTNVLGRTSLSRQLTHFLLQEGHLKG